MKTIIGQQGEVLVIRLDALPAARTTKLSDTERTDKGTVVGHSESGHHHVLTGGADVMERTENVPSGMRVLYAAIEKPEALIQDAPTPHDAISLEAGFYEFRISREYDPFEDQIRAVAD